MCVLGGNTPRALVGQHPMQSRLMFLATPFFGGGATPHAVSCLSHEPMVWRIVTFHVTLMQKLEEGRVQKSVYMFVSIHIQIEV